VTAIDPDMLLAMGEAAELLLEAIESQVIDAAVWRDDGPVIRTRLVEELDDLRPKVRAYRRLIACGATTPQPSDARVPPPWLNQLAALCEATA
jgi:hypothetical protein